MRTPRLSDERGVALAVALLALVVIGALAAGTFFAGQLEQRGGQNSLYTAQAFEAADAGTHATIAAWNTSTAAYNALAVGAGVTLPTVALGGGAQYTPTVSKLNPNVFFVRSEGARVDAAGQKFATSVVGNFVRLVKPEIDIRSALTVRGSLTLGGSAEINGTNNQPIGWGASCSVAPDVAGIRINTNSISTNGANCGGSPPACVTGTPPVQIDNTITATTFTDFGSTNFDLLAAGATWSISGIVNGIAPSLNAIPVGSPPGTLATCKVTDSKNWGEPNAVAGSITACFNYFPIIYAPGDVKLNGGRGQGILLVRGDLDLAGGVEFYGPVIVLGNVKSTGTGGHVYGGVMASNADLDPSIITGNSVVNYSACAVQRALAGAAIAAPFTERSWAQLY